MEPIHSRPTPAKRRKEKDNPYTIFTIGIETDGPHYYLSFKDSSGIKRTIKIDKTLFTAFNTFELDDFSFMDEVDNHSRCAIIYWAQQPDATLYYVRGLFVRHEARNSGYQYRAAPGAAKTGNGVNDTPAQSQSER